MAPGTCVFPPPTKEGTKTQTSKAAPAAILPEGSSGLKGWSAVEGLPTAGVKPCASYHLTTFSSTLKIFLPQNTNFRFWLPNLLKPVARDSATSVPLTAEPSAHVESPPGEGSAIFEVMHMCSYILTPIEYAPHA